MTVTTAVSLDLRRKASAGTDFTVLSTVATAVSLGVGSLAVAAAGKLGYPAVLGAVVTFLALGALAVAVVFQEARPAVRGMEGAR
ncbi:hypothetical protein [Prauserella flavalba]|uniref:hypothetical protein n=1 Tax=Prauserella flavalba TaxID=1477506 RepID=UPI0036E62A44